MSDFSVLHALRVGGAGSSERLSAITGLPALEVEAGLSSLQAGNLVEHDESPFGAWSVTDSGRTQDRAWIDEELAGIPRSRERVEMAYQRFLALNGPVLDTCGAWQVRRLGNGLLINDHSDEEYDSEVLDRLVRSDRSVRPILADLCNSLSRFRRYEVRLADAIDRAVAGHHSYVTESLDSYHAVWFQLHEDLLVTLDLTRGDERSG